VGEVSWKQHSLPETYWKPRNYAGTLLEASYLHNMISTKLFTLFAHETLCKFIEPADEMSDVYRK